MSTPSRIDAVLVDTSAFYVFLDARQEGHGRIAATIERLTRDRVKLIFTNHIRAETHALILNRRGHYLADRFLAHLTIHLVDSLVFATQVDEARALEIVAQYQDKDFSLADCISFAVMERLGITHALTLDHNFEQYGLIVL